MLIIKQQQQPKRILRRFFFISYIRRSTHYNNWCNWDYATLRCAHCDAELNETFSCFTNYLMVMEALCNFPSPFNFYDNDECQLQDVYRKLLKNQLSTIVETRDALVATIYYV